jgi:hypothetical protein
MVWPIKVVRLYPEKIAVGNKPSVQLTNPSAAGLVIHSGFRTFGNLLRACINWHERNLSTGILRLSLLVVPLAPEKLTGLDSTARCEQPTAASVACPHGRYDIVEIETPRDAAHRPFETGGASPGRE